MIVTSSPGIFKAIYLNGSYLFNYLKRKSFEISGKGSNLEHLFLKKDFTRKEFLIFLKKSIF